MSPCAMLAKWSTSSATLSSVTPGVARFLVQAILWRDYPVVQNLVMFIAVVVVLINFLIDMAYIALDPRIKIED